MVPKNFRSPNRPGNSRCDGTVVILLLVVVGGYRNKKLDIEKKITFVQKKCWLLRPILIAIRSKRCQKVALASCCEFPKKSVAFI